jgi:outer membrane protein TolC
VNSTSTSVQVSGPYGTSVLAPDASGEPLSLTIETAIQRGLKYNLGAFAASVRSQSARSSVTNARSALLPTVSANFSEYVERENLAAMGFDGSNLPSIGTYFPSALGPFHYYAAQAQLSHNAFDLVATRNYMAAKDEGRAANLSERDAREQIVLAVAATYLQVLAQAAQVGSIESQVKYAQAAYDQAVQQRDSGAKSSIDVNRSRVELQRRQQQLLAQSGENKKQKMNLARLIGLSADREFSVAESFDESASELPSLDDLYQRAMGRNDVKASEAQLHAAEEFRRAAVAERLPSVRLSGFYGVQGPNFNSGTSVYSGTATLSVPIFNGGQTRSDLQQADATIEQRRTSLSAKKEDVRFEVRSAWIDQDTAMKQLVVAESNRVLAQETLHQSMDRFNVGAADSVEVVQSQETLAAAEQDYINSLYSLRLAQMNLARAAGSAEQDVPKIIKGVRP